MSFVLSDDSIERGLEDLAGRQPVPSSKIAFTKAVLRRVIDACNRSGDPEAWRRVGPDPDRSESACGDEVTSASTVR